MPAERKPRQSKILTLKFSDPREQRIVWAAAMTYGFDVRTATTTDLEEMFVDWCHAKIDRASQQPAARPARSDPPTSGEPEDE